MRRSCRASRSAGSRADSARANRSSIRTASTGAHAAWVGAFASRSAIGRAFTIVPQQVLDVDEAPQVERLAGEVGHQPRWPAGKLELGQRTVQAALAVVAPALQRGACGTQRRRLAA